jgi:hypothetical protein
MPMKRGSVAAAIGWMFLLEILLFWLPVVGSLIAGFVGGRKAGGVGQAAAAVFLPVVIFAVLLSFFATAISAVPLIGALAGFGGFVFAASHVGPLLFGAIVGGLTV